MRDFWDRQHQDGSKSWLTFTPPNRVFEQHSLPPPTGKLILDIGVGDGEFSRWCAELGNSVIACDISPVALSKLVGIARTVLVEDIATTPPVDLAICHLVFQHCDDKAMSHILHNVQLAKDGLFSMQTAHLDGEPSPSIQKMMGDGLLVFRSLDRAKQLVKDAGLSITWTSEEIPYTWQGCRIIWHIIHAQRS